MLKGAVVKSEQKFHNPTLQSLSAKLEEVGKARFVELDKFTQDCKTLTGLFQRYGVPDIEWVFYEHDNASDELCYALGYHEGTIVWCLMNIESISIEDGDPIYEASASARADIMKAGLLDLLMEDAILLLEEKNEKERKELSA